MMYNTDIKNKENNQIGGNKNVQQADHYEARVDHGQELWLEPERCAQGRVGAGQGAEKEGKESGWNYKVVCNDWVKGSHNRTYVSARIYTNAWNRKRDLEIGYIDNMTGALVAA